MLIKLFSYLQPTDEPAKANTSDLNEELGQVGSLHLGLCLFPGICLSISLSPPLSKSLSLSLPLSLPLSLSLSLSPSLSLPLSLSLSLPPSLYLKVSVLYVVVSNFSLRSQGLSLLTIYQSFSVSLCPSICSLWP